MSDAVQTKVMNRGWVVVGAILIQLCLGAIYAWSVFTTSLTARDAADVTAVYSASGLGTDEASLTKMRADLKAPKAELKKVAAEFDKLKKSKPDREKLELAEKDFEAKKTRLLADMDQITATCKVKEKVDALKYGFSKAETQAIFSAGLAAFAVVMVLAGRMLPKVGPRKLAVAGGVVLGIGYVLAGLLGTDFWTIFICVGLIGGSGIGLGYVVPITVGMRWFPDKKGLITGLGVAGFGFGATLWITLAHQLGPLGGGHLLADIGISKTFAAYGIAYLVIVLIGSTWMTFPPQGWKPANWTPPAPTGGGAPMAGAVDFTSKEMLRTPQFYTILLTFAFGASAGLMSIGLMNLFPKQALLAKGVLNEQQAGAVASLAMGVFFALCNGLGRIAWGTISDKIGRKPSIIIMMATQGLFVITFQWMAGDSVTLCLFAALIGFNFGGNFALFPTITADTFGARHIGQNYGWVFLAYGVGGIFGPILGGKLGDLNNFPLAFTICGVLCLVAAVLIGLVKHPKKVEAPAAP